MPLAAEKIRERIHAAGTRDVQLNLTSDERCIAYCVYMACGDFFEGFNPGEWM